MYIMQFSCNMQNIQSYMKLEAGKDVWLLTKAVDLIHYRKVNCCETEKESERAWATTTICKWYYDNT